MLGRALALVCCAVAAAPAARGADVCAGIANGGAAPLAGTTILSTTAVPADAARGTPEFCEVRAAIAPTAGSRIGAVYRLPATWNGKVLGIGGGGFAGDVTVQSATAGLARGYAVIQNDLGHPSTDALDPSFALTPAGERNVEGIVDFGHRATHLATMVGKALATQVYGRTPEHAYFQGCSTGGRQGLAEVQRYPHDYDGVIAGAPVYTPLVYSNAILRVQAFHAKPESNLTAAQVPLIQMSVLAACDALDGVSDGILTDPRACTWDPGELECKSGAHGECLTPAQVATVRRVYAGVKTRDGQYAAMPIMRGGESDWVARMVGTPDM
ncbi:MAG TPA: tannase/feruloyl esterase family alpha/beta hydrolase, partial [Gammaproteobacteria bacterium]|nr:tannase/feruloyl esterase family alpha/beta hydrolase [Gammaproteobacteria bacterium]